MPNDKISEKWSIDFEVIFHDLCHTPYPLLSQKMNSGFCATNIEKFRTLRIPLKSANDSNFNTVRQTRQRRRPAITRPSTISHWRSQCLIADVQTVGLQHYLKQD
ncbi:hypothetical protein IVG45_13005 [Methylomonas sp. LL1]|nr:hypothetical protein IVG45_13005 [Methylomonas sp. LL1]